MSLEYNPIQPNENVSNPSRRLGISGLGGWLVLVQIGLYATILLQIFQFNAYILPAFATDTWEALTSKDSSVYDPLWKPLILFEAAYSAIVALVAIYSLVAMYRKKSVFPSLMIGLYAGTLLLGIADYAVAGQIELAREFQDDGALRDIVRAAVTCLIWIPYFIRSVRVKNTFVR